MSAMPKIRLVGVEQAERVWRMRLPFHYGVVTLNEAIELQVACRVEVEGFGVHTGYSGELAAPKWFNKDAALSPSDTVERLRRVLTEVIDLARAAGGRSASFADLAITLDHAARDRDGALAGGFNDLEISYALALIERAIIDALCRALDCSFQIFLMRDGLGLAKRWPHNDFALDRWLDALRPPRLIAVRHTVGLSDPLTRDETANAFVAGRPVALEDVIAVDRVSHFKVKFAGGEGELARLRRLSALLEARCGDFRVTLDANEAFVDVDHWAQTLAAFEADPALTPLWSRVRYIEQPFDRRLALGLKVDAISASKPLLIDESDDRDEAFAEALVCGYLGVSVKTCKGVARAVLNAARAARAREEGRAAFVSAEDLSVPPGLALQQNIALVAALGLIDAERNGHHFGPGPAALPPRELADLVDHHPDLYTPTRLHIEDGAISASSALFARGFGTVVRPQWTSRRASA